MPLYLRYEPETSEPSLIGCLSAAAGSTMATAEATLAGSVQQASASRAVEARASCLNIPGIFKTTRARTRLSSKDTGSPAIASSATFWSSAISGSRFPPRESRYIRARPSTETPLRQSTGTEGTLSALSLTMWSILLSVAYTFCSLLTAPSSMLHAALMHPMHVPRAGSSAILKRCG